MRKLLCKLLGHRWFPVRLQYSPDQECVFDLLNYPDTIWCECRRCGREAAAYANAWGEVVA